jgi:hypothetical protein
MVVIGLILGACSDPASSSSSSVEEADPVAVSTTFSLDGDTTQKNEPATTLTTSDGSSDLDELELGEEAVDFVVAVDELLIDTAYEGLVTEDPEVFVATGLLFCEQLSEGVGPSDILVSYVEALTGGDIDDADDDTLTLAGSILGTAVGYLCPEHVALLEEGL